MRAGVGKTDLLEQHGHVLGLQDINIDMREGDITVVMGLSGSGKSTLIRHLNRLIEPTSGQVDVDGEDVLAYDEERACARCAAKPCPWCSRSSRFCLTALWPRTPERRSRSAASASGTIWWRRGSGSKGSAWAGYENHYPHQLSGGMQQRVGIARALTSNSPIMLMDEAFSALDPLIRTDMQDLLLELQKELHKTIVFITHDLDEALKLADRLIILKDGHIVQQDEPQYILLNPNDPYIEDFVSDINRARVLRVRSIMTALDGSAPPPEAHGEVDFNETLESIITRSGGDTSHSYTVMREGTPVGVLEMTNLVKALVPRAASEAGARKY